MNWQGQDMTGTTYMGGSAQVGKGRVLDMCGTHPGNAVTSLGNVQQIYGPMCIFKHDFPPQRRYPPTATHVTILVPWLGLRSPRWTQRPTSQSTHFAPNIHCTSNRLPSRRGRVPMYTYLRGSYCIYAIKSQFPVTTLSHKPSRILLYPCHQ